MYYIIAWLPGEPKFMAKDQEGNIGFLNTGGFRQVNPFYVDAATSKYGYRMCSAPVATSGQPDDLDRISEILSAVPA